MSSNRIVTSETKSFYEALEKGDLSTVKSLISNKEVDLNWKKSEDYGGSSILVAIMHGHEEAAILCIEAGSDPSITRTPDLNTALHEACHSKFPGAVASLLSKRSNFTTQGVTNHQWDMVEATNQFGNTALHSAAAAGNLECVKLLVEAGANIKIQNNDLSTPLHYACYAETSNQDVIDFLIKSGGDVNARDKYGVTPLIVAAKKNQVKGTASLLSAGADKSIIDENNHDALYYSKHKDHPEIAAQLA